ncbi:MAG: hypothetical protein JNN04_07625 [Cyclobacteriaceae bacterium]|nr:hypothetical protein [Cyclobacteriaceae bacterium]
MAKKFTYLFLALLVPGLIFVFLKFAGSNRFDVPVYPQEGIPLHSACVGEVTGDYRIPDSAWQVVSSGTSGAMVIQFPEQHLNGAEVAQAVKEEIGEGVSFFSMETLSLDSTALATWKSCVFLLEPPRQAVLVDSQRRIRGFYDLGHRDEVDRLRLELKILLEKY